MDISQLLGEKYLERFRIFYPVTLFPPNWDALLKNACPLCGCKLYEMRNKPFFYCKSKRNGHSFIINKSKMK